MPKHVPAMGQAMRMLMTAGLAAGLGCGPATAQIGLAPTDNFEQCRRPESMAESRLKFCSAVIEDRSRIPQVRAEAFLNRGMAYEDLNDLDAAIADYSEGLKLNSNHRALYNRRGLVYDLKGRRDLAIADFSQVIRIDPKDTEALIYRGLAYAAEGDHTRAILDYDAALSEEPDNALLLVIRGESREAAGDRGRAMEDYRKALDLDPGNEAAEEGLARLK